MDVEDSNTQTPHPADGRASDDSLRKMIIPRIDRILAKTAKSPLTFALDVAKATWFLSTDALGPLASQLHAHFTDYESARKWDSLTEAQFAVHKLDSILSLAHNPELRETDMTWIGCPLIPDQLLYLIHRRMEHVQGDNWMTRPIPRLVKLLGQVDAVATALRDLVATVHSKREAGWQKVEDSMEAYAQLQDDVELQGQEEWVTICGWSGHPTLLRIIKVLDRRSWTRKAFETERRGHQTPNALTDTTVTIRSEPKEGHPRISKEDEETLNTYLGRDATKEIDIDNAGLLTEATGM